jgi:hypothetical protein
VSGGGDETAKRQVGVKKKNAFIDGDDDAIACNSTSERASVYF